MPSTTETKKMKNTTTMTTTTTMTMGDYYIFVRHVFNVFYLHYYYKNNRNDGTGLYQWCRRRSDTHSWIYLLKIVIPCMFHCYTHSSFTWVLHCSTSVCYNLYTHLTLFHTHKNIYGRKSYGGVTPTSLFNAEPSLRIRCCRMLLTFQNIYLLSWFGLPLFAMLCLDMYLHSESFAQLMNSLHTLSFMPLLDAPSRCSSALNWYMFTHKLKCK